MSFALIALVLLAALLHAGWNGLLKSGGDRFRAIVIMSTASGAACVPALALLPMPAAASWPAILVSAALHIAYNLFLVAAYQYGDLGQVYPVARGASPLLVTLGALLLAGEHPDTLMLLGIALVSFGIVSLAHGWNAGGPRKGLVVALTTGVLIACYTVTDGLGGRLSGAPVSYAAWLFVIDALPMPLIYWATRRDGPALFDLSPATTRAAAGGLVSLAAYAIVIYAASIAPMGGVSALRETSVVFAALIGKLFLDEVLTWRRLLACATVGAGAILLGYH
ncbi:EamA family transporter [Beijerinckia sp. L45]|uniref:EamA family transporter n=1 Tax=Beijerinckia sp. L45 TaxID=1641855 RepID=UPI00131DCF8B|nr:EamA family transporter [Beijerinckia sp. L45]